MNRCGGSSRPPDAYPRSARVGFGDWATGVVKAILRVWRSFAPPAVKRLVQPTRPNDRRKLQRCVRRSSNPRPLASLANDQAPQTAAA
jgi:hypothetical protein